MPVSASVCRYTVAAHSAPLTATPALASALGHAPLTPRRARAGPRVPLLPLRNFYATMGDWEQERACQQRGWWNASASTVAAGENRGAVAVSLRVCPAHARMRGTTRSAGCVYTPRSAVMTEHRLSYKTTICRSQMMLTPMTSQRKRPHGLSRVSLALMYPFLVHHSARVGNMVRPLHSSW